MKKLINTMLYIGLFAVIAVTIFVLLYDADSNRLMMTQAHNLDSIALVSVDQGKTITEPADSAAVRQLIDRSNMTRIEDYIPDGSNSPCLFLLCNSSGEPVSIVYCPGGIDIVEMLENDVSQAIIYPQS